MGYRVVYKSSVAHDLKQLDKKVAERVLKQLKETLSRNPNVGQLLAGEFRGLYRMRVGDYRVVYAKTGDTVLVLRIRHQSKVY